MQGNVKRTDDTVSCDMLHATYHVPKHSYHYIRHIETRNTVALAGETSQVEAPFSVTCETSDSERPLPCHDRQSNKTKCQTTIVLFCVALPLTLPFGSKKTRLFAKGGRWVDLPRITHPPRDTAGCCALPFRPCWAFPSGLCWALPYRAKQGMLGPKRRGSWVQTAQNTQ